MICVSRSINQTRRAAIFRAVGTAICRSSPASTSRAVRARRQPLSHLAQHLALHGYRVLAIDLDPQASLTAMFGYQPEMDVGTNETIYGAIRYDSSRREMAEIMRATYIPGLHLVPGQIELMEFEHETPMALMRAVAAPRDFFARIGGAISQVADATTSSSSIAHRSSDC